MTNRFLSPSDFRAAVVVLRENGISMNELHKIFECGNNQPGRWAKIGAPRYVALALAAVLDDLAPWVPESSKGRPRASKAIDINAEVDRLVKIVLKSPDTGLAQARIDKHKRKDKAKGRSGK